VTVKSLKINTRDLMRLPTTRHTPLTGDVRTVAVLNGMQTASFQVMNR